MVSYDAAASNGISDSGCFDGIRVRPSPVGARESRKVMAPWALALVAGALWAGWPMAPVSGQEARTLVSNTGQPTATSSIAVLSIQSVAIQFTTGASAAPWTLSAIRLDVGSWQSGATPTVSLHGATGQSPGATIATLTNPTRGVGLQAFSASSGSSVTLQANTTYTVVVESDTTFLNYNGFSLRNTESAAEDSGGGAGWQVSDNNLTNSGTGWSASSRNLRLRMAVLGAGGTVSDDATLSALALSDENDNAVSLSPTFAAATTGYTASVAHSTDSIAVTAATTHGNATVSISNDDDSDTPGAADLDLAVGANAITVTVTAEDATTTNTYTVTVTRAAAPPPSAAQGPRTLVGNTGQSSIGTAAPVFSLQSLAMQFTTGESAKRWTLTGIRLEIGAWRSGVAPTVSLRSASGQRPGATIATLTNPTPGTGSKTFAAPSGSSVKLQANTTYTVVIESASLIFNGFTLVRAGSTDEDGGGASGWRIADSWLSDIGQGWSTGIHRLKLAVEGAPDSDDVTLSALTLDDTAGNAITLDPAFASDSTDYTATVAHTASTLKVAATATDAAAAISIANDDDTATPDSAVLDLETGENTVTVTVTAEDAATTGTYTVRLTRAASGTTLPTTPAADSLVSNIGQPVYNSLQVRKGQRRVGMKFTTGASASAWTLTAVRLHVTAWRRDVAPTVKLRAVSGGWPGTTIATLTNPAPGTGSRDFTAPSGLKLQPNTTYAVIVAAGVMAGRFELGITKRNHEDSGGAAGWSISDTSRFYASGSWSGRPQSLMMAVRGAAIADEATAGGLTGWFASSPSAHDGSANFTVRMGFSDPLSMSRNAMRDHAVRVAGGSATSAKRVNRRGDLWDIRVSPTGPGAVTVTMEGGRACETSGAVCTADGSTLAETLELTVPGPVALSAADASAREGPDASVDFAVTLNRAASRRVKVDYATTDGTARAGEDYTATSGTLTFAPGTVKRTVSVPVLDDSTDEGEESFTLTLSNASGAVIADGEAMGTIVNSDPMPRAWIARFGRTVASQTVSAVRERLEGTGGSGIAVGGIAVGGMKTAQVPDREPDLLRRSGHPTFDGRRRGVHARSISPGDLLLGSAFRFGGANGASPSDWTAWGRIAFSEFEASEDDVEMDGEVMTGFLGLDLSRERWIAGLAAGLSEGEGWFELVKDGRTDSRGRIESRLTGVFPYASYALTGTVDVWALAGYGAGRLTVFEHRDGGGSRENETDLSMRMWAMGFDGKVLPAEAPGKLEVAVKSDAFWVRTESEAVTPERAGRMEAASGDASRLRLAARGSQTFDLDSGNGLTPSIEVGVRHDGGDAETGAGLDIGAGLRVAGRGFAAEGAVSALVAHADGNHEQWGASGSIRFEPGDSGRGLSFSLSPAWGTVSGGAEQLWALGGTGELAPDSGFGSRRSLAAEVAYGLGGFGAVGALKPYMGVWLASGDSRTYRTGAVWTIRPGATMRIEATRDDMGGRRSPAHSIELRATTGW